MSSESNTDNAPPEMAPISIEPIGIIHSPYKEKFGIPRQSGIAPVAKAKLELLGDFSNPDTVRGLEHCTHIWVMFLFSEHLDRDWTPLVRPPRSGGGKMGVFATRSTFRPNPIGLSAVKLEKIETENQQVVLHLSGIDILDGTPVIDIKPYLPYADRIPDAHNDYAPRVEQIGLPVSFTRDAVAQLSKREDQRYLRRLIEQILINDPRPTHQRKEPDDHEYGIRLEDLNIRWQITDTAILVNSIEEEDAQ